MNRTVKLLAERCNRFGDVRATSTGADWPYGVILHREQGTGRILYRGFYPARSVQTPGTYPTREQAVAAIRNQEPQ